MQQTQPRRHPLEWRHPFVQVGLLGLVVTGLIIATHLVLRPFSPRAIKNDLYAIKFLEADSYVKRYQLQGDRLQCSRSDDGLIRTCATVFEGKPLIVVTENTPMMQMAPVNCSLTYGDVEYGCEGGWDYENRSPSVLVHDDLGISAETFQQLRRENRLLYLQEGEWLTIARMVAALLAIPISFVVFTRFRKEYVATLQDTAFPTTLLIAIFTLCGLSWIVGLLWDSPQAMLFVWMLALLFGFWCWQLLHRQPLTVYVADRTLAMIGAGTFAFSVLNFLMLCNLLMLGFVD